MNIELTDKQKVKVRTDSDLYPIMREILLQANKTDSNKEHLWVCGLGVNHKLLYIELVSLGTMFQSITEPMDIFSWALQKQVPIIILVHNHPSEVLLATQADKDLTDQMIQVGDLVGVKVVDHLIITTKEYFSFERSGLLAKLRMSDKFKLSFLEAERIKKEALRIGEGIGEKKGIKKVAKSKIYQGNNKTVISNNMLPTQIPKKLDFK
ncbi:MAG: DNA repair protein [Cytophagales bacterium]|nr:DNA repair protein [Cytophagales bacterium]